MLLLLLFTTVFYLSRGQEAAGAEGVKLPAFATTDRRRVPRHLSTQLTVDLVSAPRPYKQKK